MEEMPVSAKVDAELGEIRASLLEMGGKVELMIAESVRALAQRDSLLGQSIIDRDLEVLSLGREIDSACLQLLGGLQGEEQDPYFVIQALKIVIDLERISDQCASIARHALELNREAQLKPYIDLPRMAEAANNALRDALDAFVRGDVPAAVRVCQEDHLVDQLNEQLQRELLTFMMENPATVGRAMRINSVSKYLERIGDHATNIAEMVVFMIEGKDVRHLATGAK